MLLLMRALPIALVLILLTSLAAAAPEPTREAFLKLLDRSRVDPAVQFDDDGSRFSFMSEKDERVPALLLKPATQPITAAQRRPVVIALHGTGGTKESQLPVLRALAERGFLAIAIDARHHGERTKAGKGSDEYQQAILRAWREGGRDSAAPGDAQASRRAYPFFYDTVWDVMRLIDYLEIRDDVDPKRIGLIGTSKGGIETYLAAAADERIAAAVPCIGVQSFRWALEHDAWQSRIGTIRTGFDAAAKQAGVVAPDATFVANFYDRVAPGLAGEFDGPAMLPLIAPRPLLVMNGDSDARTPLPGLKLCTDAAHAAYDKAGAADRFTVRIQENTGHKVTPESRQAAIDWLVTVLNPVAVPK
jgi:dienelactone hydrolase